MKKFLHFLILIALATGFFACSSKDEFTVNAIVNGLDSEAITMVYFDGHALQRLDLRSNEQGAFIAKGVSPKPTFVEILRADGSPLVSFVAQNGDKVKIEMDLNAPDGAIVSGTKTNEALTAFVRDNADALYDPAMLNTRIAAYVANHPGDIATTAILMKYYSVGDDVIVVDSLFKSIEPEARPLTLVESFSSMLAELDAEAYRRHLQPIALPGVRDSMLTYVATAQPYSILAFTANSTPDSVRNLLTSLRDSIPAKRLRIVQIYAWTDSASVKNAARRDSSKWDYAWAPGGVANPSIRLLSVPRTPFFIVADSTGTQRYRGSSVKKVRNTILNN